MKSIILICLLSVSFIQAATTVPPPNKTTDTAKDAKDAKNVTTAATPVAPTNGTDKNPQAPPAASTEVAPTPKQNETNVTPSNAPIDNKTNTTLPASTEAAITTPAPDKNGTTTVVPITDKPTEKPNDDKKNGTVTTVKPVVISTTPAPHDKLQARAFDGASFVGGIILTLGLLAIGFMGFKYYKNQTERNYHTL